MAKVTPALTLNPNPNPNPRYVIELLAAYTERLSFAPALGPRSVRFACRPTRECRACDAPGSNARGSIKGRAERSYCGVRCAFRGADGTEYDTLHEAGLTL